MRNCSPGVDVTLQRHHVAYAREEAERRHTHAGLTNARHGTTKTAGLGSYEAHEIGAVCELATSLFTRIPDRFFDEDVMNLADVGLIEVRGTKVPNRDLRVYEGDVKKAEFMVLAVIRDLCDEGAIVRLRGWAWSEHAWHYSTPAPYEPHPKRGPCRFHPATALRPMNTLVKTHNYMEAW